MAFLLDLQKRCETDDVVLGSHQVVMRLEVAI